MKAKHTRYTTALLLCCFIISAAQHERSLQQVNSFLSDPQQSGELCEFFHTADIAIACTVKVESRCGVAALSLLDVMTCAAAQDGTPGLGAIHHSRHPAPQYSQRMHSQCSRL